MREDLASQKSSVLLCAYLLTAIAVMGAASVVPALPFLGAEMGVGPAKAAWVIGFFIAPAVVLTPAIGVFADRVGLKPTVIGALSIYAICAFACVFATSFELLIVLRLLQGVGAAALELLALVMIATVAKSGGMRSAMGRNAAVIGICLCVYPVISGILADFEWRYVFLFGLAAAPVALFVQFKLSSALLEKSDSPQRSNLREVLQLIGKPDVRKQYVLILALFVLLFGCFFSFVPEAANRAGIASAKLLGLIPLAMAFALAISASLMNRFTEKVGERGVVFIAALAYAVSLSLIIVASTLPVFLIAGAVFGFAHGMLFPLTQATLGQSAPSVGTGTFMSANAMAIAAGQTLGPFLVGAVVSVTTLDIGFVFGIGIAGLIALTARK